MLKSISLSLLFLSVSAHGTSCGIDLENKEACVYVPIYNEVRTPGEAVDKGLSIITGDGLCPKGLYAYKSEAATVILIRETSGPIGIREVIGAEVRQKYGCGQW